MMRILCILLLSIITIHSAYATIQRVTGNIIFAQAIELSVNNPLQFGSIDTSLGTLSHSASISTDDTLTDAFNHAVPSSSRSAATVTVIADSSKTLQISINSVVNGQYFSLSNFTCKYNNRTEKNCSIGSSITETAVYSGILKIGATLTGLGTPPAQGSDSGQFTLEVVYL